jgi:hypothetical protein
MTHRCSKCGLVKSVQEFAERKPGQGWRDDTGKARHSYCRTCEAARLKEWRERDIEASRARSRARYAERVARAQRSPEEAARLRETRRLYAWERRRRRGEAERGIERSQPEKDLRLEAGPFRDWLLAKLGEYGNTLRLAHACGTTVRRIYSVLKEEQAWVSIDTVDRALTREGSTYLFQLYPRLYPDVDVVALSDLLADVVAPAEDDDQWLRPVAGVVA